MSSFGKDIDNNLLKAILSENIAEIEYLIKKGANINAIDEYEDSILICYIRDKENKMNIDVIKYLVGQNIDTNYEVEGFNCLFNVYLANRSDIFEFLLMNGTNTQCISTDSPETLLDWIEFDLKYEKEDSRTSKEWISESEKIIKLMKDYGAINAENCITNIIEDYLKMFGGKNTGLFTKKGFIRIEDIPNIKNDLINKFNNWKIINNEYLYKTWNEEDIDIQKLIECNNIGMEIIKEIKELLPKSIKLQFNYIIPEDYKKNKVRNIYELII